MRPRIVIVDDDPSFLATVRLLLEAEGFVVVGEALNGVDGIAAVAELEPDIVLVDVNLPDIETAFEVVARLADGGRSPPVVLTSIRSAADFSDLIETSRADGFISKAEIGVRTRSRKSLTDSSARRERPAPPPWRSGRRPWSTQAGSGGGGVRLALWPLGAVPGTLNVRLPHPLERGSAWWYVAAAEVTPDWQARTGQAGYFLARVTVAEQYRGLAFQARRAWRAWVPTRPDRAVLRGSPASRRSASGTATRSPSG